MSEKPDHTLVFTITNKSTKRLRELQDDISGMLEDSKENGLNCMNGTDWDHKIDGKES